MIRIRQEQVKALSLSEVKGFENRMLRHLASMFPDRARTMGKEALRVLIRDGTDRAAFYSIVTEFEVCLFLYLMIILGVEFDSSREHAWVRSILDGPDVGPESRVEQAFEAVIAKHGVSNGDTVNSDTISK